MGDSAVPDAGQDDKLEEALAEWLDLAQGGEPPDESEFLARHPHLADALRKHLATWRRFQVSRGSLSGASTLLSAGATAAPSRVPSIPGHELLGEIGRGGMGVVYRARHLGLDRIVAVKLLSRAEANPTETRRFLNEPGYVA
jgi:hypothetical protein